jgi:hypothetical protein
MQVVVQTAKLTSSCGRLSTLPNALSERRRCACGLLLIYAEVDYVYLDLFQFRLGLPIPAKRNQAVLSDLAALIAQIPTAAQLRLNWAFNKSPDCILN